MKKLMILGFVLVGSVFTAQAAFQLLEGDTTATKGTTTTSSSGGGTGAPTRLQGKGPGFQRTKGGPANFTAGKTNTITTTGGVTRSNSSLRGTTQGTATVDLNPKAASEDIDRLHHDDSFLKVISRTAVFPVRKVVTGKSGLSKNRSNGKKSFTRRRMRKK